MNPSDTSGGHRKSRLSLWSAAFVIARRDFQAILFSRAFLFFLLGPVFLLAVGALSSGVGSQIRDEAIEAEVGIAMSAPDTAAMLAAHKALAEQLGRAMPPMVAVEIPRHDGTLQQAAETILEERRGNYAAIVTGSPSAPVMTGTLDQLRRLGGSVAVVAAAAIGEAPTRFPEIATREVATSGASAKSSRVVTAQISQMLLFLLTMLLAGMVLSNLVEEKGNKIIEVLAAAIPMDAVFLGKLFAMLGVSMVGILVWGSVAGLLVLASGADLGALPPPAVGWPLFLLLGVVYFSMGYLLLGSIFLAIGSMAATVREVQTLSMPVTMLQLLVFFFASYAMARPGSPMEVAAAIFPLSSPFAMMARAAQMEDLWPHALALLWQVFAVAVFIKAGATLFRKRVMKSGPQGAAGKRRFWQRKPAAG
ncbi:ABC transporter permease [Allopontixanthobacter sp.]|uniref:ABC transporter permease n=1 Tax=Allopontixanthobacter sp. TaxID=2906452 RepID=UPI002ABAF024|nr:ABC transporter permease [Allopontixanthobacter sp.]MDZ4306327.1 ABC transporter permease [Allopontixanthobacter sp.]